MTSRPAALALVTTLALALAARTVHADGGVAEWDYCDDCSSRDWILTEPGVGPEIGPLARIELGTAGVALDDADGGHAVTAGFARVRLAVGLRGGLGVRASGTMQALGTTAAPFPAVGGLVASGALGLGVSKRLGTVSFGKIPIAATLDGELARGLAVRSGLGLRSLTDGDRTTIAPGLAGAFDFYVGSVRAHARYLHTRGDATATTGAIEVGVGALMRINWARDFWGGRWPLEAWLDYRHRRGLDDSSVREHEVRGGLDYTPPRWLDRVGVEVAGTSDHLAAGRTAHGLAMLVTLQYGQAD